MASDLAMADVDNDGMKEIITCGFTYNGTKAVGQLRIWNQTYGKLNLEKSVECDVDGNHQKEIIKRLHRRIWKLE